MHEELVLGSERGGGGDMQSCFTAGETRPTPRQEKARLCWRGGSGVGGLVCGGGGVKHDSDVGPGKRDPARAMGRGAGFAMPLPLSSLRWPGGSVERVVL